MWSTVINSAEILITKRTEKRPVRFVIGRSIQLLQGGDGGARLQDAKQWVSEGNGENGWSHLFEKLGSERMVSIYTPTELWGKWKIVTTFLLNKK